MVFRDQTLAGVAESARIKYKVGPTIAWYQDFLRYYFLTVEDSIEGSLTRRFAVLLLLLCMFGLLVVLLRRGKIPGAASGPVWRLIGSTAIGLLLLTFTPTKWAVQFGAFAGLAGALGGVTAFAFSRVGLHSRRNLALYVTALLFVLAWATSGINGWFYVGNYGVPWFDRQPVILHQPVTTIFLVLAIVTGLLAGWLHFRMDYTGHTEVENTRRNRVLASTPLLVVASIMVVLEVGLDGQGLRPAISRLHHRQGEPVRHRERPVGHQLRDGRRCARRGRHQRRNAGAGPRPDLRPVRSARRPESRRVHPERRQRRPRAAAPGRREPGHGRTPTARPTSPTSASHSPRAPAVATAPSASTGRGCSCRSGWTQPAPR